MPRTTSNADRQRIEVNQTVKKLFKDLKQHLGMKSDSEAVAYLLALYTDQYEKEHISVPLDKKYRIKAAELQNQIIF